MIASKRAQLSGEGPFPVVYALGRGSEAVELLLLNTGRDGAPDPMAHAKRGVFCTV